MKDPSEAARGEGSLAKDNEELGTGALPGREQPSPNQTSARRILHSVRRVARRLAPWGTVRGAVLLAIITSLRILRTEGIRALLGRAPMFRDWGPRLLRGATPGSFGVTLNDQYLMWLKLNAPSPVELQRMTQVANDLTYQPLISVIMPVHNVADEYLRAAIESVRRQTFPRWELCIVDDGSGPRTQRLLKQFEGTDPRIVMKRLEASQGIAAASNQALRLATGEFVAFLDHDDELQPQALFRVVELLQDSPQLDLVYSDEDKLDLDGVRCDPFFKPGWSPDLLTSMNYLGHLTLIRRALVTKLGGFRAAFEGSQDHDLVLRATETTDAIAHLEEPLYSWRKIPGSVAASPDAKTYAYETGKLAVREAMHRRGYQGEVLDGVGAGRYRARYKIHPPLSVEIIIPTRNGIDFLSRCIDSIVQRTTYPNYEILVVDNDSDDPAAAQYLRDLPHRVMPYPGQFNYSTMMNQAATGSSADVLLFLNNDTVVISSDWMEAMVEHVQRPEVGAVGARLLYPDGRVQHEGIIIGLGGSAGNVDHGGYFDLGGCIRNCSAVTGACMMMRREVFEEADGFEERLGVAFNDVDLCLRLRQNGYEVIYTPHALLYHHEGASRGLLHPSSDEMFFRERWGHPGEYRDPYYNGNFSLSYPFTLNIARDGE